MVREIHYIGYRIEKMDNGKWSLTEMNGVKPYIIGTLTDCKTMADILDQGWIAYE